MGFNSAFKGLTTRIRLYGMGVNLTLTTAVRSETDCIPFVSKVKNLWNFAFTSSIPLNPLNGELNPIRHLLALLGAHHILHVSRIRVKACSC